MQNNKPNITKSIKNKQGRSETLLTAESFPWYQKDPEHLPAVMGRVWGHPGQITTPSELHRSFSRVNVISAHCLPVWLKRQ